MWKMGYGEERMLEKSEKGESIQVPKLWGNFIPYVH